MTSIAQKMAGQRITSRPQAAANGCRRNRDSGGSWMAKRALDVLGAAAILLVLLPLLLVVALLIRLDSPGPILFGQERCGRNGRLFRVWKFRTMAVDAERRLAAVLAASPAAREEYARWHKLANDPRVTRAGRFLRKTSLDEIPQLLNVLRGDMSLVGPRPYMPNERDEIGAALPVILTVPPGITGLWQITARNSSTFQERVAIDCTYVRYRCLKTDLIILLATMPAVLRTAHAY